MDVGLFNRLRTQLIFEIGSFEGRLQQLLAEDYPTESAPSLIRELISDLTKQRDRIQKIIDDLADDPDGAYQRLRSERRKLLAIYIPYVVYLQSAQTRKVPWSIVPSIERLASYLLPGRQILTTCLEEFNYRLIWDTGGKGLDNFDILLIPSSHRLNAFLHILIGHELFHPLLDRFLDTEQANISAILRSSCETLLSQSVERSDPFFEQRLDRVVEAVRAIWRAGMEELVCDLGCVRLFGPSAVLAFAAFVSGAELDSPPSEAPYYPPNRFRLRKMLEHGFGPAGHLQEFDDLISILNSDPEFSVIVKAFEEHWEIIEDLARDEKDLGVIRSNAAAMVAYNEIEAPLERAWQFINSIVLPSGIPWTHSYWDVLKHLASTRVDVPCGELRLNGRPYASSSVSSIALSAWLNEVYAQTKRLSAPPSMVYEDYFRACRIMLKSLEDAELKTVFEETIRPKLVAN